MNQNVLPWPSSLSTPMVPPISSTSRFEMASPSPVPPNLRVVDPSACENDWNRRLRPSGEMPIPVSLISNRTVTPSPDVTGQLGPQHHLAGSA